MYYNNLNRQQDDDLKFIPLNISEPFTDKDSSWFPIIDMALPTFSEIPNSFALGFVVPCDNSNIEWNSLKTLDYIQNDTINVQSNNINQETKEFEQNFNLEYPSETLGEALFSYNKDEKCKKNTNLNQGSMQNTNSNMNKMSNTNIKSMENRQGDVEEPIHMELLKNFNFGNTLYSTYRGEEEIQQEDMLFNMLKSDNSIGDTFKAYNMPKPISDLIIKKIIRICLENSNNKWGE